MGQLDNIPENSGAIDTQATEAILRAMTQDLENLKQNIIVQLNQDVERLQAEKSRLIQEIDGLQTVRQQQLEQQQQMAQVLVTQLREQMMQQLHQLAADNSLPPLSSPAGATLLPSSVVGDYNEQAYRLIASLDSTLRTAFKTLQQDLNSYQSALSQQLSQMHTLEQQGEMILETLVNRLSNQLQAEVAKPQLPPTATLPSQSTPAANPIPLEFPAAPLPLPPQPKQQLSQVQLGFLMVLLSTIALSIHNVVVRIVGTQSNIFGQFPVGGFIKLDLGNSILILWIRMLVVLPLMVFVAMFLHPPVWQDLKKFLTDRDRRSFLIVVGSGCCLFLSQVLIYIAIGDIGPGIAVTILFMYPIVTVPLAWLLFGDRPSLLRVGVMFTISLGVFFAAYPSISSTNTMSGLGVGTAALSGIGFAFYLILMQLGFQKLHPVPVSLIQFSTIFVLSSFSLILPLILPLPVTVKFAPSNQLGLIVGGVILGGLTLLGYLLNNFGVRFMGAARASIIASSGPVLTALLAFLLIPGPKTALQAIQIMGILLVTLGVFALSFERMLGQRPAAKPAKG
jgi:drug/metabolite transporter (DMT)-like permease